MSLFKSKAFWLTLGTALGVVILYPKVRPTLEKIPVIGGLFKM